MKNEIIGFILSFIGCLLLLTILDYLEYGVQNINWNINFYISIMSTTVANGILWFFKLWEYIDKKLKMF